MIKLSNCLSESEVRLLWESGILVHTMTPLGRIMRQEFIDSTGRDIIHVFNTSRKNTKTTTAMTILVEKCIKVPGTQCAFIAPTENNVEKYVTQVTNHIFNDCPVDLLPQINKTEIKFSNNSVIMCAGLGNGSGSRSYNNLRPFTFDLAVVDESAFTDSLETIVDDVLIPTVMPRNGRIMLLSTPPEEPDHPFLEYCEVAKQKGCYSEHTIRESHYSLEIQEQFIEKMGGINSPKAQREYFCKTVIDRDVVCVPEFNEQLHVGILEETEDMAYYQAIMSLDT